MAVEDRHPTYLEHEEEWQICTDTLRGQQAVKEARTTYLPCPTGFAENPDAKVGAQLFDAYIKRAEFPDMFALTLRGMVGLVHRQEAVIEGLEGTPLESLHENCTRPDYHPGQTLMSFHQSITHELVAKGRAGVLTDAASKGSDTPWLVLYPAETITNWAPDGKMFVLDESGLVRSPSDEFSWVQSTSYRVLRLIDGQYIGQVYSDQPQDSPRDGGRPDDSAGSAAPRQTVQPGGTGLGPHGPGVGPNGLRTGGVTGPRPAGVVDDPTVHLSGRTAGGSGASGPVTGWEVYTPKYRGGKVMNFIPIVVGGPLRMTLDPDTPPLLGVGRAALSIYRLNADYRHQLFMSGQETLYATGVDQDTVPKVVGAGVIVGLPVGSVMAYASPTCSGIDAHAKAIADEESRAVSAGVQLFDQGGSQQSGDALRLRYGAQTATLITIARQSAAILEGSLRNAARIVGMSQEKIDKIIVKPNLEFLETLMSAQDATNLVTVWQSGAISYTTLYENFVRGGIASGERTAEQEQDLVAEETPDTPLASAALTAPDTPAPDAPAAEGDTTEAGPDSVTDEELLATFGDFASDVVG